MKKKKRMDKADIEEENFKDNILYLSGMYENWFLDYASYVILERAIPNILDGLKPVQRRILHSLKEIEDGRYHKVANVIGNTMKYHPHGDASIGDAMVQIGQKELLLDMQGNWGNVSTGDKAAASRYIEVRLTDFALKVVFNNKVTDWISAYDGRGKEPKNLPVKFPLLLAQGVEGIAVGLSTKILPHNFNELIDASIKVLKGIKPRIYPDFQSGGTADFTNYNDGKRGGKILVRARIEKIDKSTLLINELPYSTTTSSLISSIIKANEKGKIKIKKIEDNTAESVEIIVKIPTGLSPDKTIDALYRFTDCEISISPLCCVIEDEKPVFLGVSEVLQKSTNNTLNILKNELEIELFEVQEKWHFLSLEMIFIQERIYRKIEELDNWDDIINTINENIKIHISKFKREVTIKDIEKLTEIKIKRITKFDINKSQHELLKLEERIYLINNHLSNITDYAINYFKDLKKHFGSNNKRKTEIKIFESIDASKVVVANQKLFINREEGFIGTSMKKDEFICECSDIDDIIIFRNNGTMKVVKIDKKVFVGKNIILCAVFKKKDDRTVYNMIYKDGVTSNTLVKRFFVTSVTRNKEYQLTKSTLNTKVLYLTRNPNGEAEKVLINFRRIQRLKKLKLDLDFANISIKGKLSVGNIVTKNPVKNIELKSLGISTLSARKVWYDDSVNRLNVEERGTFLGDFQAEDKILTINQSGILELRSFDVSNRFPEDLIIIEKLNIKKPISVIYFDGLKKFYFVKRFCVDNKTSKFNIVNDHKDTFLELVFTDWRPLVELVFVKEKGKERKKSIINIENFISVKGQKALGNKLSNLKIKEINVLEPLEYSENQDENQEIDPVSNENSQITLKL